MVAKTVQQGSTVHVWYEGRLEDGHLFDTNKVDVARKEGAFQEERPHEPLIFKLGDGHLIPGFEKGILGMKEGEEKTITIAPAEGYGVEREELFKDVDESFFKGEAIVLGMVIMVTIQGENVPARVVKHEDKKVVLDFNHPLSGKTLTFTIKIEKIE